MGHGLPADLTADGTKLLVELHHRELHVHHQEQPPAEIFAGGSLDCSLTTLEVLFLQALREHEPGLAPRLWLCFWPVAVRPTPPLRGIGTSCAVAVEPLHTIPGHTHISSTTMGEEWARRRVKAGLDLGQ